MPKETPEEKELRLAKEAEEAEKAKLAEEIEQARLDKEKEDAEIAEKAAAEIAEEKRLSDLVRNTTDTISIKGVVLKGSAAEKTGTHSIHLTPSKIINFVNGKAEVKEDVERALRDAGHIE